MAFELTEVPAERDVFVDRQVLRREKQHEVFEQQPFDRRDVVADTCARSTPRTSPPNAPARRLTSQRVSFAPAFIQNCSPSVRGVENIAGSSVIGAPRASTASTRARTIGSQAGCGST